MSIISPFPQQTVITLYRGIPWDNTDSDIRWFTTESQRTTYFGTKYAGQWLNCSIVKIGKSIKLEGQQSEFINCNYMSFVNNGLGNERIFYAFITAVNYINNNTFEVEYEIDWIQSYLFSIDFEVCTVEREHVNDDTVGKWTLDEKLPFEEYAIEYVQDNTYEPGVIIYYLADGYEAEIRSDCGMAVGTLTSARDLDDLSVLNTILSNLNETGQPERVASMRMGVTKMLRGLDMGMTESFQTTQANLSFEWGTQSTYVAKNNRMKCYPYKVLTIDNYQGGVEQYRYEDFDDTVCSFGVNGTAYPTPVMMCFPINYKGWHGNNDTPNTARQYAVLFDNFPEVPWVSDTYRAWVTQNAPSLALSGASKIVQTVAGAITAGVGIATLNPALAVGGAMGAVSGLQGVAQEAQDIQQHKLHSMSLNGGTASAGLSYFQHTIGFRITKYCLKPDDARRIDQYLTRYGYRVDCVKVPNVTGRQYVNYVKTTDAHVKGNIPVDTKTILEKAMNGGCSFWHVDNIGMVLTDNPIV